MKKTMLMMAAVALFATAAQAQEKGQRSTADRAKATTELMTKELTLTPEQTAKVQEINAKYMEKMGALRAERKTEGQAHREEGSALKTERDAELKAVLTPEQHEKWQAHEKARMDAQKTRTEHKPKAAE